MDLKSKDLGNLSYFLHWGIDLHKRRIYFGHVLDVSPSEADESTDFTPTSVGIALRALDKMVDYSNKQPIEIHMSSFGGDSYFMLALIDKLEQIPCKTIFYGSGAIMSAATWVMSVCDERYLAENTSVMLHDSGYWTSEGTHTDIDIANAEDNKRRDDLVQMFAKNSLMPAEFFNIIIRRDLYLTAQETVELGLADALIKKPARGKFRKGVRNKTVTRAKDTRKMKSLVNRLFKRIKVSAPSTLEISMPEDKEEDITLYDNTPDALKE